MSRWSYLLAIPLALGPVAPGVFAQQASPAQTAPAQTQPAAPAFTQAELEQILAPIALYPDDLLTQILVASTYPLEVVMANRWLAQPGNMDLKGDALLKALDGQDWDASVKSLVPFPTVLKMMSDQLDWTQKLGDAFLAQQSNVFAAVQALRGRAQATGTLQSNTQQIVTQDVSAIVIQPAQADTVYVPAYNPTVVYGTWPYPSYPPAYYPPPAGYYLGSALATGLAFGTGVAITGALWGWGRPNWGAGNVNVNVNRFNSINANSVNANRLSNRAVSSNTWQHNADHRRGVGYTNPQVRQQYRPNSAGNAATRDALPRAYYVGDDGLGAGRAAHRRRREYCQTPQGQRGRLAQPARKSGETHRDRTRRLAQPARQCGQRIEAKRWRRRLEFPGQTGEHVTAQSGWGGQCASQAAERPAAERRTRRPCVQRRGPRSGDTRSVSAGSCQPCRGSSRRWRGSRWRWRSCGWWSSQRRTSLMQPRFFKSWFGAILLALPLLAAAPRGAMSEQFASPDAAVDSLVATVRADDVAQLRNLFGEAGLRDVSAGDPVANETQREKFIAAYNAKHAIDVKGGTATLSIGADDWPFPIPLKHEAQGWSFDVAAGREEILESPHRRRRTVYTAGHARLCRCAERIF